VEVSTAQSADEFGLRAGDRDHSPRVFGLAHSCIGISPAENAPLLGETLQSGAASHGIGSGYSPPARTPQVSKRGRAIDAENRMRYVLIPFSVDCTMNTRMRPAVTC
jgi:hypothetical protein